MKKKHVFQTIDWSVNGSYFKNCGSSVAKNADNFTDYLFKSVMTAPKLYDLLKKVATNCPQNEEMKQKVFQMEDECLFDRSLFAIEIILNSLKDIDMGNAPKVHWVYLDSEKKAVVHFINKRGWYAELYCLAECEASFLHLVEDDMGHKAFVPVMFLKNLSKYKDKVAVTGGVCLRDYLPRQKFDFLSKKAAALEEMKDGKHFNQSRNHQRRREKDNRDSL